MKFLLFVILTLFINQSSAKAGEIARGILNNEFAVANKRRDKIYVFISFSMPDNMIKDYVSEAGDLKEKNNIDIIFVLRGFYKNSFKETSHKIGQLSGNKNIGVIIDPNLYKKYGVEQVPTIAKENNDDEFDKIIGSISIRYALEKFTEGRDGE
jgi:type-F conjugative transfer system pilin assembly protein TrbC